VKKVRVGDTDICYEILGTGPPLVMIMGLTANIDWWSPQLIDDLANRYRVLIFDNRGSGRTEAPPGEFTIKQFADDTAGLIEAVGIKKANVLGVSMGGMIAQELAINHPRKVDKLILCATNCGGKESIYPPREILMKLVDRGGTTREVFERVLSLMFPQDWLDSNRDFLDAFFQRYIRAPATEENALRQFVATARFQTYERLPKIKAPTLVMTGKKDVLIPPENSRIIASRIPGAKLVEFEDAGHGFIYQCREKFLSVLEEFLSETKNTFRE